MIRINVAPELSIHTDNTAFYRALAVLAAGLVVSYFGVDYYAGTIKDETAEIIAKTEKKKEDLRKLKLDLDKTKSLQARLTEVRNRATQIKSLSAGRKQPVLVLDKLQQNHLERMWFQSLKLEKQKLIISGLALDHTIISEYVRRLKTIDSDEEFESEDMKNFVPSFLKDSDGKGSLVDVNSSILPLSVKKVELIKSAAVEEQNVTLQKFDVQFETNVPN